MLCHAYDDMCSFSFPYWKMNHSHITRQTKDNVHEQATWLPAMFLHMRFLNGWQPARFECRTCVFFRFQNFSKIFQKEKRNFFQNFLIFYFEKMLF